MPQAKAEPPAPWPGARGWIALAYTGKAPNPRPWRGAETGLVYWFGGDRRFGFVDARDAVKWLAPRRTGDAQPVVRVME